MVTKTKKEITNEQKTELLSVLKSRFEKNMKPNYQPDNNRTQIKF